MVPGRSSLVTFKIGFLPRRILFIYLGHVSRWLCIVFGWIGIHAVRFRRGEFILPACMWLEGGWLFPRLLFEYTVVILMSAPF